MRATRPHVLLTVLCGVALTTACSSSVDGNAGPAPVPATQTPATTAQPSPTTRTTTAVTTTAAPAAQAAEYMGNENGSYYFTSPSGKFECAVVTAPAPVAGCHGQFPSDAPAVPTAGGSGTASANAIRVTAGKAGEFFNAGDPAFHRFDGPAKALPYGSPLRVQGFTCTVDQGSGVTCESGTGHGFTVSDSAYRLW
ncbi:hypothetical protein ACFYVR_25210 [Rhodococcus sp. NPDC003318]|uniref:hypothetical protein n=1 Tax=Rhodococcus sp. NPDC003318 TaxID=3364503 RepID=UPI00367A2649